MRPFRLINHKKIKLLKLFASLTTLISSLGVGALIIPPEPPAPNIPALSILQEAAKQPPSLSAEQNIAISEISDPTPTAWVFELNNPMKLSVAKALVTEFNNKGVPAFTEAFNTAENNPHLTTNLNETQAKVLIGPEIDLNRLNLLETRVNINSKLGTVRRFQIGKNTELTS